MHVKVGVSDGDFVGDTNIAIQLAVDAVGSYGGGTVELKPGVYTLSNSIRLHRNVRLVGAGPDTVLRPCPPARSALLVDADYGQKKVALEDPSGFAFGMGVIVADDHAWGYAASVATITAIQGNTAYLDRRIAADCSVDRGAEIWNAFSLIAAVDVDSVTVEGLTLDGAGGERAPVNGCVGGGIYLYQARRCRIADCVITGFAGDGISYQTTQDILVERCEVTHSAALGIHPGTGSVHTIVRKCRAHHNGEDGLYLCFRVQEGLFEDNDFSDNGQYGISIGHKDTDNTFTANRICRNRSHGVCFRDEAPTNAGSRNVFRANTVEDNGECGFHIGGHTTDLLLEGNTIRDTRSGNNRTQRIGICAGEHASEIRSRGNHIENNIEAAICGRVQSEE